MSNLEKREKIVRILSCMYGSIYVEIYWGVNDMEIDNRLSRIEAGLFMSTFESSFPMPANAFFG